MTLLIINILTLLTFNFIDLKKILHNLQQNRYNEDNRYLKWINKNKKTVFLRKILFSLIIFLISFINFNLFLIICILFNIYLIIKYALHIVCKYSIFNIFLFRYFIII